jgi:ubiquinone/menaquinone biosynthesis C-methylase UbiE
MPNHFQEIYDSKAAQYDALVSREDYLGHIASALQQIRVLDGLDVVELGAGTGRLTRLLAPIVKSIQAFDASKHMLQTAAETLGRMGLTNWTVAEADNRQIPVEDGAADLAIAGWSFGHTVDWSPDSWRAEIGRMIDEMLRVVKIPGTIAILETLGTGNEQPAPPTPGLAAYYSWLEEERGFQMMWIRTDYRFESVGEADQLTRFFFGDSLADRILNEGLLVLPECTGIWWRGK